MQALNPETLAHALKQCYDYPNYNVGIVFGSIGRKIEFLHTLYMLIHRGEVPGATMIREKDLDEGENNTIIRFRNGSTIETILSEHCRRRSFHVVLADPSILDGESNCLQGMKIPYPYIRREDTDVEDDAQELNEFLNGFVIQ